MEEQLISQVVSALRDKEWKLFEELIRLSEFDDLALVQSALTKAHGNEIDLISVLEVWPESRCFTAMENIFPSIKAIETLSVDEVLRLLKISDIEQRYLFSVMEQLQPHFLRNPKLAKDIGEHIISDASTVGIVGKRAWSGAFCSGAPSEATSFMLELARSVPVNTFCLSIILQNLPVDSPGYLESVTDEVKTLSRLLSAVEGEYRFDALRALASISICSGEALSTLMAIVRGGDTVAISAIAKWLPGLSANIIDKFSIDVEAVVDELLRAVLTHQLASPEVDICLSMLIHRSDLRNRIIPLFIPIAELEFKFDDMFPNTLMAIGDNSDDFRWVLTAWLLGEKTSFITLRGLISICVRKNLLVGMDHEAFATASPKQKVIAVKRLLGLTHQGDILCLFAGALAESESLQPDGLSLATDMLNELYVEFPGATADFLRSRTRPEFRQQSYSAVYRDIFANALRWQRVINRLSVLKETRPSDLNLHVINRTRQRTNREIMRAAHEKSFFSSFAKNMHIAQGWRFASHDNSGNTSITDMMTSSHSIELPSSERSDPVGGAMRRHAWLRGAK